MDAPIMSFALPGGSTIRRETRTSGGHGWLMYSESGTLLRAIDKYECRLIDAALAATVDAARIAALEEAAKICEQTELHFSTEVWLNSTKLGMSVNTANGLADVIRAAKTASQSDKKTNVKGGA